MIWLAVAVYIGVNNEQSVFSDQGTTGILAKASVITFELCASTRRYLDIEAAMAGKAFIAACCATLFIHEYL
jgi:hypothetical protein